MKTLFQPADAAEIIRRINNLQLSAQRQWGKMDPAQMLAHCSAAMEVAAGQKFPPRIFISYLFGRFLRPFFSNEKPFQKNTPTDKSFVFSDQRDFQREKEKLVKLVNQFSEGGEAKCTSHPHSFFGKLTPREWGIGMHKHLDHHLRQFSV